LGLVLSGWFRLCSAAIALGKIWVLKFGSWDLGLGPLGWLRLCPAAIAQGKIWVLELVPPRRDGIWVLGLKECENLSLFIKAQKPVSD